jgi:hypothetical protein
MANIVEWPWGGGDGAPVEGFIQVDIEPAIPEWVGYRIRIDAGRGVTVKMGDAIYEFEESTTIELPDPVPMKVLPPTYDDEDNVLPQTYDTPAKISWLMRKVA